MKRIVSIIVAILATVTVASAKGGFGVTAGLNFNSTTVKDVQTDARAGWSAGVTYQVRLPLGLSLQPSLMYMQQSGGVSLSNSGLVDASLIQTVGSLVLPVSVQWGPDLIVARPFVDVTPYVGYALLNKVKSSVAGVVDGDSTVKGEQTLDYGVGIGAGINVWRLQAVVRYNWNFGAMGNLKDFTKIDLGDLKTENQTFGGISVNVAFFF